MKVYDEKRKGKLWKTFGWKDKEIKIELDAYEFESDLWSDELEGDCFYKSYSELKEALKKFIELLEKGWEEVTLSFLSKDDEKATFVFRMTNTGVCAVFSVNKEKLLEDCGRKLSKIWDILVEGDSDGQA